MGQYIIRMSEYMLVLSTALSSLSDPAMTMMILAGPLTWIDPMRSCDGFPVRLIVGRIIVTLVAVRSGFVKTRCSLVCRMRRKARVET